ncbi:hypothetical protein GQ600_23625 [Phytophthora cactorum]|nr:hypothetical protein GQ600_23625 [Phytophthora cactorum]
MGNKCRLDIGERVALPESLFGSAARAASHGGEWILAERKVMRINERSSGILNFILCMQDLYAVCSQQPHLPQVVLQLRQQRDASQREMTHHLVAYVFQVLPGHVPMTQQNQQQVSERNNVNPGCLLPAIDTSTADNMQAASSKYCQHRGKSTSTNSTSSTATMATATTLSTRLQIEQETRQRQQPGRLQSTQTRPSAIAAPFARSLTDRRFETMEVTNRLLPPISRPRAKLRETEFWQREVEATAPGFREKGQQLLILWYFLEYVSMDVWVLTATR